MSNWIGDALERALLLNVVVRKRPAFVELPSRKEEPQSVLVRWDPLLFLDLGLDVLGAIGWLHLERNGLAGEGLDKYLHPSAEAQPSRLLHSRTKSWLN